MLARERPLTFMRIMAQIPYLAALVIAYLVIAFIDVTAMGWVLFTMTMPSGGSWTFNLGDLFVLIGLLMLFGEILKATRTSRITIADHALSLGTFVVALLCFLLLPQGASSTLFLITWMTLIDVIGGFTITLAGARRDIGVSESSQL